MLTVSLLVARYGFTDPVPEYGAWSVQPRTQRLRTKQENTAFGGVVAAAALWTIWGGDMFPAEADPKGNPESWTKEELRRWLAAVCLLCASPWATNWN